MHIDFWANARALPNMMKLARCPHSPLAFLSPATKLSSCGQAQVVGKKSPAEARDSVPKLCPPQLPFSDKTKQKHTRNPTTHFPGRLLQLSEDSLFCSHGGFKCKGNYISHEASTWMFLYTFLHQLPVPAFLPWPNQQRASVDLLFKNPGNCCTPRKHLLGCGTKLWNFLSREIHLSLFIMVFSQYAKAVFGLFIWYFLTDAHWPSFPFKC